MQEKAQLWLEYGSRSDTPPSVTVWCCFGALHFAEGDGNLQSEIYRVRALSYYNLGDETRCEQDVKESKIFNIYPTLVSFFQYIMIIRELMLCSIAVLFISEGCHYSFFIVQESPGDSKGILRRSSSITL